MAPKTPSALAFICLATMSACAPNAPAPSAAATEFPTATTAPTAASTPTQTAPPTATPCAQEGGRLERIEYPAQAVPGTVPALVYLPRCYVETESIPALYLLHGYPFDEGHWIDLGVVDLADRRILAGEWPPLMLIMPRQPEPLFRGTAGGPGSYEQEFLEGLLPYVESSYAHPAWRGLLGISRGGVWALEIGLRHPDLIEAVGAFSPALAVNHAPPAYDPFDLIANAEQMPARMLLLYGDGDWAKTETVRLSELLHELGFDHQRQEVPGEHVNSTWAAALPAALELLLPSGQ